MSEAVGIRDIDPYLNTRHWDGHTLGVGDTRDTHISAYRSSDSRFAREMLRTQIQGGALAPMHTFYAGDIFDPADYHPGAVVLFREETLYGKPVEPDYSLDELVQQAVPLRPTATSPSFGVTAPLIFADDGARYYICNVRWGVVPRNDMSNIYSIPASGVSRAGSRIFVTSAFIRTTGPVIVGETVHTPSRRGLQERLRRINILHLIASGTPERQSRRVGFILRPAFGNAGP